VAWLYCPCEQQCQIWGEFWWTGGKYTWVFFDDRERSETYTDQITQCPTCGQRLERENLERVTYRA
jgi:hypothetical protein